MSQLLEEIENVLVSVYVLVAAWPVYIGMMRRGPKRPEAPRPFWRPGD
jgi:hypothetical protein